MTVLRRAGAVVFGALATLSLLLAVAALAYGRLDGVAFYAGCALASGAFVGVLMRRDMRRRRAEEAALPPEARPARRVPRRPIQFPLFETAATFVAWYLASVLIDRAVTGTWSPFTLVAIAPFAAFMLTALTVAGRHMAFRLTAEEAADPERDA